MDNSANHLQKRFKKKPLMPSKYFFGKLKDRQNLFLFID